MSSLGEAVKSVCGKITSSGAADQVDVLQHVLLPSLRDTEQEVTDDVVSTLIRVLGNAVQRHQSALQHLVFIFLDINSLLPVGIENLARK
jgi:hypothetical protein